ncbi:MAG: hypothetical protein ABSE86_16955 [Bryobacteraceae bacterium]|jgi:hypothetical protein
MTHDEIRKLLGGYATNSLTDTERQALFEAALEDQELFNALHQEQALKELLADPLSRAEIRQALEKPRAARPHWWIWTAAASAVAAAVIVALIIRPRPPEPIQQYASVQTGKPTTVQPNDRVERDAKAVPAPVRARASAGKPTVRARSSLAQNERKDELQSATVPAAPTAPPPAVLTGSQQAGLQAPRPNAIPSQSRAANANGLNQQSADQAANSIRDQEQNQASPAQASGAVGGLISKSEFMPVRYTLLKRDADGTYRRLPPDAGLKAGDAVRVMVTPMSSGYLSLSRRDASGEWTRVFPQAGPGIAVTANTDFIIPDSPIDVTDTDQTLRLTLQPSLLDAGAKLRTSQLKKELTAAAPFVVDLTIGPKKVP